MVVGTQQRYTKARPCPICAGYDRAPRGTGVRCFGFLSPDGHLGFCTRPEKAGSLTLNSESETYTHHLAGPCGCGEEHGAAEQRSPAARAPRGEIEASYEYRDEQGKLLFEVVRLVTPGAGRKSFYQRKRDPSGGWQWKLGRTRRVLYRLPELISADPDSPVFVVEGEKDVNRLYAEGFVATTNPGGALKWRDEYAAHLAGRRIIIIPDNDPPNPEKPTEHLKGQKHAMMVARSVARHADSVRVLELPELPPKGDVSDFLDAGGTPDQLLELAGSAFLHTGDHLYSPAGMDLALVPSTNGTAPEYLWVESKYRPVSKKFMADGILKRGFFIFAEGRHYYFDDESHTVYELASFDMEALLSETYELNSTERFYSYLLKDMAVECHQRGLRARICSLAHYDRHANLMFLDLGEGRMLKLDGRAITEVDNGTHQVLFAKSQQMEPWHFIPNTPKGGIGDTLLRSLNFAAGPETPHTAEEQQLLLFIWMLSIAFESIQPLFHGVQEQRVAKRSGHRRVLHQIIGDLIGLARPQVKVRHAT